MTCTLCDPRYDFCPSCGRQGPYRDANAFNNLGFASIMCHTPAAREWIEENVGPESYQWNGYTLHLEGAFLQPIIDDMENDGLIVGEVNEVPA